MALNSRVRNTAPLDYVPPPWPSLYWPYHAKPGVANYLYYARDIWRHTLLWTLVTFGVVHFLVAIYAVAMQLRIGTASWRGGKEGVGPVWRYVWVIPVVYALVGGVEAVMAGSFVGLILGAVYNSGYFRMSTWIPFVWSLINVLVLIVSSFSIQGAL